MKKRVLLLTLLFTSSMFGVSCSCSSSTTVGSYTLTLDAVGGTFKDGNDTLTMSKLSSVSSADALETPTRSKDASYTYSFNGWYDGKGDSANKITFPVTLTKDTTFYTKWDATPIATYSVTLDANGGKFSDNTTTYTLSGLTKLKESDVESLVPTYDDKVFLGWFYSTTKKTDGVSFPVSLSTDLTIYAMWGEANAGYTVNINPNGGTFSDDTTDTKVLTNQYTIDYSKLDQPLKDGYVFIGYNTTTDTSSVLSGKVILESDITLYALYIDQSSTEFRIVTSDGGTCSSSDNKYTLSSAGTYDVYGTLSEGQIYVDASEDDEVDINLHNVSISSSSDIPLYVNLADKVKLKAEKDTSNYIYDKRTSTSTIDGGAIYADSDLSLVGKGSLHIEGNWNNGIHCEKDLSIKNLNLYCRGYNNGLRGENSVTIESGTVQVVAKNGDGIKTTDNGLTSKNKQKGNVTITGGNIDIDSYCDGISAAYNVDIEEGEGEEEGSTTTPVIDIKTNKYAVTDGESADMATFYIRSKTKFSSNVYLYTYDSDKTNGTYIQATYAGTETVQEQGQGGGDIRPRGMGNPGGNMSTTYYLYTVARPTNVTNFQVMIGSSTSSITASSGGNPFSSNYNMVTVTQSSSTLNLSWGTHTESGSSTISSKGIKAENKVLIGTGSEIDITAYDDGIRANGDSTIESTSTYGEGIVKIDGGTINIYSTDKGIHADNYLYISGGETNISNAYEGMEAAQLYISGGTNKVYATDDGLNAAVSDSRVTTKSINISGGFIDVAVADGDTDGIDSNGTYNQTGGVVISRASSNNNMSTGLDTDGNATVSGSGVLVTLGARPEPAQSNKLSASSKSETSTSVSKGDHTLTISSLSLTYTFNARTSYTGINSYWGSEAGSPTIS